MDTSKLKAINDDKAAQQVALGRHEDLVASTSKVSDTILLSTESLIKYLEGHTTKTEVVNQLEEIHTPDVKYVVEALQLLDQTLKTHENTDLTEITKVMQGILDEAKLIPKKLPDTPEKDIDYTDQFKNLTEAIKAVERVVEAQELVAEAPVVNVKEPKVNVEAPDLKPLQTSIKDVVKAVKAIVIPEAKLDTQPVEKLLKKSNVLLNELLEKPVSGGGGGGSTWIATNSEGIPVPIELTVDGKIPVEADLDGTYIDSFGHLIVGSVNNQIDIQYYRDTPANLVTVTTATGGTATATGGMATYATTTAAASTSKGVTNETTKYTGGAEVYSIFTAAFPTVGSGTSFQRIGLYDTNNGFFLGYEGNSFGVTVRKGAGDVTTPKASFSEDTLVGGASSKFTRAGVPEAINLTRLNVFRIRYGWVGSAPIKFEVLSPDGEFVVFHIIKQPNLALVPSIENSDIPFTCNVVTGNSGTALSILTNCWVAGTTQALTQMDAVITDKTYGQLTRSVITGETSAGGGGYVNVKVKPSGALEANVSGTVTANLSATDNAVLDQIELNTDYGTVVGGGTETGALRVTVANNSTGVLSVDDNGSTLSVDDGSGSLTVDAPVGTPAFVRLSDGASAISTLPVSLASVPSHAVTNAGTFAVQAAQSGTWNIGTVTTLTGITNNVNTVEVAPTTVLNGNTNVTTAGTRVVLASSTTCKSVTIKAKAANTGIIYVGSSTVSSANGFALVAGETVTLDIANLTTVNLDASVSGEGVTYVGIN